jgi:HD-GYP domain-containing protein (c-di-GMP phosphodiesterase class II)
VVYGPPDGVVPIVVLSSLGVTSWILREPDVGSRVQLSFISIILLAAGAITGPVGGAIVGAGATILQFDKHPLIVRGFNIAMFSGIGSLCGFIYDWSGGVTDAASMSGIGTVRLLLHVGVPMIVADVVQCLLNALLIATVMRVSIGTPVRSQVTKLLGTSGLAYIGYGVIGFIFVVLWIPAKVGWFSAVLVLAPLFVARWAFVQYGDELRAHERTLRALVTAVEIKEPHNAGHSERVAQLCEWLAETMGLRHQEIRDVRTAGMLHDIGKVGVPTRLLLGRQPLTDDEAVIMADHALGGVDLIQGIDFLAGSVEGIAHHHERVDGLGYPSGLAGEQISLSARIVAVADVFDSLTTSRPYRRALAAQEGLAVLQERAGTQFDSQVVAALQRVLSRHEWRPTERAPELLASAGVALDHDDPEASDYLADRPDLRARIRGAASLATPRVGGRA